MLKNKIKIIIGTVLILLSINLSFAMGMMNRDLGVETMDLRVETGDLGMMGDGDNHNDNEQMYYENSMMNENHNEYINKNSNSFFSNIWNQIFSNENVEKNNFENHFIEMKKEMKEHQDESMDEMMNEHLGLKTEDEGLRTKSSSIKNIEWMNFGAGMWGGMMR